MKTVMKQTFLPMMKNNDLSAAKQNAAELYEKAVALQNGNKPKAFRKVAMKEKFEAITANAKEMKELVERKASDEDIKNSLVTFHGAFAEIAHHEKAGMGKGHMKVEGKHNM
jgi:predicted TPR repeat methyltransferase